VHELIVVDPKVSDSRLLTVSPLPVTVTELPLGPWLGVTDAVIVVTKNSTVVEDVLVAVSVVSTPWVPPEEMGTAKVQTKPPLVSEVMAEFEYAQSEPPVGVRARELKDRVAPELTVRPDPVAVNDEPTGPCVGVRTTTGVTRNDWLVKVLVYTSVALTVCDPGGLVGTAKSQTKSPDPSAVMVVDELLQSEPPVGVWATLLKSTVTELLAVKPVPSTSNVLPTGPVEGLSAIEGPAAGAGRGPAGIGPPTRTVGFSTGEIN
jgi:hypothetical protein